MRLRIAITIIAAAIAASGIWQAATTIAWAAGNGWNEAQVGNVLAGGTNLILGCLTAWAAWRHVRGLAAALVGFSTVSILYVVVPSLIRSTGPYLDLPGYYLVVGFFAAFGVPLVPIGYVAAAAGLRRLNEQKLGWPTWLAAGLAVGVLVVFIVMYVLSPDT